MDENKEKEGNRLVRKEKITTFAAVKIISTNINYSLKRYYEQLRNRFHFDSRFV